MATNLWANGVGGRASVTLAQKTPEEARFKLEGVAMDATELHQLAKATTGTITIKGRKGDAPNKVGGHKWNNSTDVDAGEVADAIADAFMLDKVTSKRIGTTPVPTTGEREALTEALAETATPAPATTGRGRGR